ncbi:hypothetical protein F443_11822, partial [Phytophthora nicotianae P1569]
NSAISFPFLPPSDKMPRNDVEEDADAASVQDQAPSPRHRGSGLSDMQPVVGSEVTSSTGGEEDSFAGGIRCVRSGDADGDSSDVEEGRNDDVKDVCGAEADGAEVEDGNSSNGGTTTVAVEPPVKYHSSWDAWHSYFVEYCREKKCSCCLSRKLCHERSKTSG